MRAHTHTCVHTYTHIRFMALWTLSGIIRVSWDQNQFGYLDFTEARDSG